MNWLDGLLLLILAVSVIGGVLSGFAQVAIGFGASVLAFLVSSWTYGLVGDWYLSLVTSRTVANMLGFATVFVGILLLGSLLARLVKMAFRISGLTVVDRLAGAVFGVVRGIIFCVVLVMLLLAFSSVGPPRQAVAHSQLAPYVVDTASLLTKLVPHDLKRSFLHGYGEVRELWPRSWKRTPPIKKEEL